MLATFAMTDTGLVFRKLPFPECLEGSARPLRVRSGGGTGLGLSICKAIVDRCGGTIPIDNGPTGGARVAAKLPCG